MIQVEYLNEETFIKHYSDQGFLLLQQETGMKYFDPIDVVPCRYTYIETNERQETEEDDDEEITGDQLKVMLEEVL
jgi:hypothetical protein